MPKDIPAPEKKLWKGKYFTYCPNVNCNGTHEETNPPRTPHGACQNCHKPLYSNFKSFENEAAFNAWVASEREHPEHSRPVHLQLTTNTHNSHVEHNMKPEVRKPNVAIPLNNDMDTLSDKHSTHMSHLNAFPSPHSATSPSAQSQLGDRKRIVLRVEGDRFGEDVVAHSLEDIHAWAVEKAKERHLGTNWVLLRNGRSKLVSFDSVIHDDEYVLVGN